jgi:diaminopimelate decarboxylase
VITEFGRSIVAKSGWVASKVEYTKMSGNKHIGIIHVGADLFVR